MERSIFKNHIFRNLRPDSDSSQKSVYTNYFPFSKILTGSWSNMYKTFKIQGKLNLPSKKSIFALFDLLPMKILKKEEQFVYTFF